MLPFDPKKPLFGFTARFPHAKRRIQVFTDERFIFFRPKNAPSDWWGAFVSWGNYLIETKQWARVEREARALLRHGHYCRVLHLPDPREGETRMWRVLWRPERGNATPVGHSDELQGTFFWPVPLERSLWNGTTCEVTCERRFPGATGRPKNGKRARFAGFEEIWKRYKSWCASVCNCCRSGMACRNGTHKIRAYSLSVGAKKANELEPISP